MTLPTYKKTIFDTMGNKQTEFIANTITPEDRKDVERLMKLFIKYKDARGNWKIPNKEGKELLVYFQKYVDRNARPNIFGCGGCAKKMVEYMFSIYRLWQNQTK
tara:strand:+ start:7305 stop:7616 length:312 start_codon:yes stop_codon:yes gene_type:complete